MVERWAKKIEDDPANKRLLEQEDAILEVTELVCQLMDKIPNTARFLRRVKAEIAKL